MVDAKKAAIYPFLIFKEAWGICRKNLAKLATIYLLFYIPYLLLVGLANIVPGDQSNLLSILAILIGLWSGVTLLTAAQRAVQAEPWRINEIVIGSKKYLLSYIGVTLLIFIAISGIIFTGVSFSVIGSLLAAKVSAILALAIQTVSVVVVVCFVVYFMIRWALSGTVCVLEGKRPIAALKRSLALIKHYVNPVVGEYMLFIITLVAASIPYMIALAILSNTQDGVEAEMLLGAINNIIIHSILTPFMSVIMVVLYKKLQEAEVLNVRA